MKKRNNYHGGALTGSVMDAARPNVIVNHKPIKLTPVKPEEMAARRIPAYKLLLP